MAMRWEEPPMAGEYDWSEISAQLRSRPNDWLLVFEDGPVSVVNAIRQEKVSLLTPIHRRPGDGSGFQVRTRNNTNTRPRRCTMYLRYVVEG